jgi:hypothetical protein
MSTWSPRPILFYKGSTDPDLSDSRSPRRQWNALRLDEQLSSESSGPTSPFTIATWNVWFTRMAQKTRFHAIIRELLETPELDMVSLQEVTKEFLKCLMSTPEILKDWMWTFCWDRDHRHETHQQRYGNIVLVKRKWIFNVRAWVQRFPTSTMNRYVTMVEFFQGDQALVLLRLYIRLIR